SLTRNILQGLAVIVVMILLAWLLDDLLDRHWIDVYVRGHGVSGELLFLGVTTLLISVGLSRQLVAFLAGYGFGFSGGLLLSMAAVVAGCVLTFYGTRWLLRQWLARHFSARTRRLDEFIGEHTFSATLLVRLLPVGNNWMVNVAAGASAVRSMPFFLGSALGFLPQMTVFALVGAGTQLQQPWQILIAMVMFVVAALLGVWLFVRFRRQHRPRAAYGEDIQETFLANNH
ncbi:MAG: VTT domain-containing protein, partial [Gammaproteobacteria bacterium]